MAKNTQFFLPLSKVTEAADGTVYVESVATAEVLDVQGEVVLHEAAKAAFQEWTDYFSQVTGGKSLGNIREMHQPWAAGKAVAWWSDDDAKTTHLALKVVDPDACQKVREGVYTGLSIQGGDVERSTITLDGKRVPAVTHVRLNEVSLVDKPACPAATFQVVKRAAPEDATMPEDVTKGAAEAAAQAGDAMKAMLATLAAACGIEGDPDTLALQDVLDAVKAMRYGKAGLEAAAAMGKADGVQPEPEADPAPEPEGEPDQPDGQVPAEDSPAPEPVAEDLTLADVLAELRKVGETVQGLVGTLAKVEQGGLSKSAATDQSEVLKAVQDLASMVRDLPAPPPGRPVGKNLDAGSGKAGNDPETLRKAVEALEAAGVIPMQMQQAVRLNLAAQHVGG